MPPLYIRVATYFLERGLKLDEKAVKNGSKIFGCVSFLGLVANILNLGNDQ